MNGRSARHTFSPANVFAGLSVAGLLLPEAVAYATIAGLAPGRALAAAIAGGLIYALLGGSRFAIVSPTSSSAAILAASLASLTVAPELRDTMATALTLSIGIMLVAASVFRLGSLAGFVSRPVLRGFAFGLAISIIARQLPKLTGIVVPARPVLPFVTEFVARMGEWHWASVGLGAVALGVLLYLRRKPVVPAALILIAGGITLASLVDLTQYGIALAGPAPLLVPQLALPAGLATWEHLAQLTAPITLIVFAESWGTMRSLALEHGDTVSPNRELRSIGLANCAAALVQGMPVGAGFSAGAANDTAGATGRASALAASIALLGLALFAGPLIARIPEPVLAAVVIGALTHALSPMPLTRLFKLQRDQWVGLAAALGVLLLGVLNGMLAAIALSIAELLYRLSHPSISELGRVGESHDFVDRSRHPEARRLPGLAIYRPNAPLFFANAETALQAIGAAALADHARVVILSLEESNDLDSTALEALGEFAAGLERSSRRLVLARVHDRVRDVMAKAGLGELAQHSTFSVADAVARALSEA